MLGIACLGIQLAMPAIRSLSNRSATCIKPDVTQPVGHQLTEPPCLPLPLLPAVVSATTETELALAIGDKERYIRLDGHIGLTGAFKSAQVRWVWQWLAWSAA